jgi:hypothetical protein
MWRDNLKECRINCELQMIDIIKNAEDKHNKKASKTRKK